MRIESDRGTNANLGPLGASEWNRSDHLGEMHLADFADRPQALSDETESEWNRNDWFEHPGSATHYPDVTWPAFGLDEADACFDDLDEFGDDAWGDEMSFEFNQAGLMGQPKADARTFASRMLNG